MVPFYVLLSTPFPVCASKVVVLLGKASGNLDDLSVAVIELGNDVREIYSHAIVSIWPCLTSNASRAIREPGACSATSRRTGAPSQPISSTSTPPSRE